jgi:hypothetical protein
VHVTAPTALIGEIAPVTITDAISNSLFGTLVQQPAFEFATSPVLVGAPV